MLKTRISSRLALVVCALLCLFVLSSAVAAGAPANVTVRVEGLTETKLPATSVTTTTTPIVKDGVKEHSCSGTSALGALELATAGNWSGPWEAKFNQYSIFTIVGEKHEFEESVRPLTISGRSGSTTRNRTVGACEAELQQGDQVAVLPLLLRHALSHACTDSAGH